MKCPECKSINIKNDKVYGNSYFYQCKDCKAMFRVSSETTTLPHLNKNRGVSLTKKRGRKAKMVEFKYLGKRSEDFIEKYVELSGQYDAKFELNEILKEMFEKSMEVFKEKEKQNEC